MNLLILGDTMADKQTNALAAIAAFLHLDGTEGTVPPPPKFITPNCIPYQRWEKFLAAGIAQEPWTWSDEEIWHIAPCNFCRRQKALIDEKFKSVESEQPAAGFFSMRRYRLLDQSKGGPTKSLGVSRALDLYAEMAPKQRGLLCKMVADYSLEYVRHECSLHVEDVVLRSMALCRQSPNILDHFEQFAAAFRGHVGSAIWHLTNEHYQDQAPNSVAGKSHQPASIVEDYVSGSRA
jgi:hypothetical protein